MKNMCMVTMPRDVWDDFMKQVNDRNIHKDIEKIQHEEIDRLRAEADQLKVKNDEMSTALGCIHVILTMSAGEDMAKIPQDATCEKVLERQSQFLALKAEVERLKTELKIATVTTKYHDEIVAEAVKERVAETSRLRGALHEISLCSQNSTSSKEECGRIARAALCEAQAAIGRGHAESQPVDRVIFDRALAGLPLLNLRIPMPPVKKP